MDKLIEKADFNHDDDDKCSKYGDDVKEWRNDNEGKITSSHVFSAINALNKKLTQGKCPSYDTEGWKQASSVAFDDLIQSCISDLLDDKKIKANDIREAYFKLYLEWLHYGPATVQLEIMNESFSNDDVNMEEYLRKLTGESRAKLLSAITSPITKREDTKDDVFYKNHRSLMDKFISNAIEKSTLLEKDTFKIWLDYSFHLYLDYPHLDDDSLDDIYIEAEDRFSEIEDEWENFSDVQTIKSLIQKLKTTVKTAGFPKSKNISSSFSKPLTRISKKLKAPGDAENYSDAMFDLMEAISKCDGNSELIFDIFKNALRFYDGQERKVIEKRVSFFKAVLPKYRELLEKLDIKFLEETRFCVIITDKLEDAYADNKTLAGEWLSLLVPLLKRPCYNCLRAANSVLGCDDAIRWKEHMEVAKQVFECLSHVQIPTDGDKKSEIKEFGSCTNKLLNGLKKARILKEFGEGLMFLGINLLELKMDNKELFELIEDIGEHIEINVKENKDKVMEVMKRIHVIMKTEDLPWTESWPLQRAVEDTVNSIIKPVNDGRIFSDDDLKVFSAMCDTCLSKDPLNPKDASLSAHFIFANSIMSKMLDWMSTTKRLGYAVRLIPLLLNKYDEEDENVSLLCSAHMIRFAAGEVATMAPHLEDLIKLYLEKNDKNVLMPINAVYPVNPAAMKEYFQVMMNQFLESREPDINTWMTQIFWTASKKQPELFTDDNIVSLIKLARDDFALQGMLIQILDEIGKRKPEQMIKHVDLIMDKSGWNPAFYPSLNNLLAALALYNENMANKVIVYQLNSVKSNPDKPELLTALNSVRQIGFKYPDIIKPKRQELDNLQIIDTDGLQLKQSVLDMIDGKTPEELKNQLEEQQAALSDLVDKVEEVEVAVLAVRDDLDQQGAELNNVKNDVSQQGQRLDQVEDTVEETVAKVEEIDSKTLSHAPYWSRDISKLLNPATEHDWRLLSSRLGYSNADIRGWAQQADPCMAMLNEWYTTRKTSEATYAILTNLQEMNRMDAALIVENAMKKAEAVVEDEEFEYASPPPIFISYQWGHQEEVKLLHRHLAMAGYDCWMDIGQMGGGDKLFEKIDNGMRAAKIVISCVTTKYAKSPNCNREVNLAVGVNKPIIPLLMESCTWPPPGSMGPIFSESLYIRFFQTGMEETKDDRYWTEDKFQELLMQLSANGLTPDEGKIEPLYRNWWMPLEEEIKIDKSKTRDGGKQIEAVKSDADCESVENPEVFISYQWGKQKNIIKLYQHLTSLGFSCWLDIKQMGGGDSLYDKIDRGIRGCKVVVSCVTKKYALSPNCRREVSLTDALKKPMLPLLLEEMTWPPSGPMSMIMTQLLYIDFHQESAHTTWAGPQFDELIKKINQHLPKSLPEKPKSTEQEKHPSDQNKETPVKEPETAPVVEKPENVNKQPETAPVVEEPENVNNQPGQTNQPEANKSQESLKTVPSNKPTTSPPPAQQKSKSCSLL